MHSVYGKLIGILILAEKSISKENSSSGSLTPFLGPTVRINPYELHINDVKFYDEIYTSGRRRRDKYEWQVSVVIWLPDCSLCDSIIYPRCLQADFASK